MNQHVRQPRGSSPPAPVAGDTFIYFLRTGNFVKIGHSRQWKQRMAHMQIGSPHVIVPLLVLIDREATERTLHSRFRRDHYRGEWFHLSPAIGRYIKENLQHCTAKSGSAALKKLPMPTSWDDR